MFAMFKQVFLFITVLFQSMERFANALNHVAASTEEMAAAYHDEARIQRQQKLHQLEVALAEERKTTTVTPSAETTAA